MINRLSNLINRNRSAAKISQVLCSSTHPAAYAFLDGMLKLSQLSSFILNQSIPIKQD